MKNIGVVSALILKWKQQNKLNLIKNSIKKIKDLEEKQKH